MELAKDGSARVGAGGITAADLPCGLRRRLTEEITLQPFHQIFAATQKNCAVLDVLLGVQGCRRNVSSSRSIWIKQAWAGSRHAPASGSALSALHQDRDHHGWCAVVKTNSTEMAPLQSVSQHAIEWRETRPGADQQQPLILVNTFVKACPGRTRDMQAVARLEFSKPSAHSAIFMQSDMHLEKWIVLGMARERVMTS